MKFRNYIGIALSLIFCAFSYPIQGQEVLDGIVAVVGDKIILRTELLQTTQGFALQMGINPVNQPEELEKLKKDVLQNLINEKVLLLKAKEDTITVEDQQVETALDARIDNLVKQLGSKEKVEAYFGIPIKKIKRDYRDDVREQLTIQTLQQEKLKEVQISRRETEIFFAAMKDSLPKKRPLVKLRHILFQVVPGEGAKNEALARIREIQNSLLNGADFEEMARLYSEDPGTASKGGNLGFVERGTLFQEFEEAAFKLEPGEISDIVETSIGFHLIQMIERRGDKINVRHILIRLSTGKSDETAAYDRAIEIRNRALADEDFGELAKTYSDDESSKEEGGDLGWLPVEELQIEAFKNVVDSLKEGEISMPFKTQFGFHIVKLEGRQEEREISLDNDYEQIREWALNAKRQKVLNAWVEELKKDMYIEIKEDLL
jgi:peptidyl-prolyl cis-trans isomerase SurA